MFVGASDGKTSQNGCSRLRTRHAQKIDKKKSATVLTGHWMAQFFWRFSWIKNSLRPSILGDSHDVWVPMMGWMAIDQLNPSGTNIAMVKPWPIEIDALPRFTY